MPSARPGLSTLTSAEPRDRFCEPPPRQQPWAKLAVLLLALVVLLPPINDLFRYGLLLVAAVLVVTGSVTMRRRRWIIAFVAVALAVSAQIFLAAPRIEEGHNVFLIDGPGGVLEASLPRQAFRLMAAEFDATYPPSHRCDPAVFGCWRGEGFPDRAFAFSADGIYGRPAYSRRVTGIDFSDPVWLRLGFLNEQRYNWNAAVSDIDRAARNRGLTAVLHPWHVRMPWFVAYRFPADFIGSRLCWRGEVLWERAAEQFEVISHPMMECRALTDEDIGRRIFGVAIERGLAMRLAPSPSIAFRQRLEPALAFAGLAGLLVLLVRVRARATVLPFALIAITLVVVVLNDASFIGGVRPFDGGDDGLVYDGYARTMLPQLLAGNLAEALRGGENVFFFTPGMRYLRVTEHLLFGESYLGYLSLILALPFVVFFLFRRFLPLRWAVALIAIFVAVPIGVLFGSSLVQYVKWAARGFADPAAYTFFLAGLVLLVGRSESARRGAGSAFGAGLLLALALFVRPNIAPATGMLLAGAGLGALRQGAYGRAAALVLGFLPVLGMALHNWLYGGAVVLFTSTAAHPGALIAPPSLYLGALGELAQAQLDGAHLGRAIRQIGGWLAGPSEWPGMAPINAAAIVIVLRVALWRRADPWLRLLATATLTQQCVGIFYLTAGRYHYLSWLLTLLVVAVWVHGEGVGLFRRAFPGLAARIDKRRRPLPLAQALDRACRLLEPGGRRIRPLP